MAAQNQLCAESIFKEPHHQHQLKKILKHTLHRLSVQRVANEMCGSTYLFGGTHAGGQQRDDGEHVFQRVDHRDESHHRHGQGVVVTRLEDHLVFQQDDAQHLDARLHAEKLDGKVKREVYQTEARVIRQDKGERLSSASRGSQAGA